MTRNIHPLVRSRLLALPAAALLLSFSGTSLRAAWTGAAADNDYNNTANWAGGDIDGVFTGTLGAALPTSINVPGSSYSFSGLTFSYADAKSISLIPPGGASWTLGGDVSVDVSGATASTINIAAPSRLFGLDLGGVQRTFAINNGAATAATGVDTLNVYGNMTNGSIKKTGGGTLSLQNTNSLSGDLVVSEGTVVTNGSIGAFTALNKVQVLSTNSNSFGRFVLNGSNGSGTDQLNTSAAIVLNGGVFGLQSANGSLATTETVGTVTIDGARSSIGVVSAGGQNSTLTLTSLARNTYSTLAIATNTVGVGNGTSFLKIASGNDTAILGSLKGGGGAAGTTTISILPWVSAANPPSNTIIGAPNSAYHTTGFGLVTYSSADGFRALTDAEYQTDIVSAATQDNVKLTAATTLAGNKTVNSLMVTGAGNLDLGGNTLTLTSGAYASTAVAVNFTNGNFNFGTGVGYVMPGRATLTIQSTAALSAGAGFVFAGSETTNLNGTVNAGTGPVVVNAGTVIMRGTDRLASGSALRIDRIARVTIDGGAFSQTLSSLAGLGTVTFTNVGAKINIGSVTTAANGEVLVGTGGSISPGDSSGDFKAGGLTLGTGVTSLRFESGSALYLDLSSATTFDSISVAGAAAINGGTLHVSLLDGFNPTEGQTFTSITGTSAATGTGFTSIVDESGSGYTYSFTAVGNNWVLTASAVPEPSSFALFGGMAALMGGLMIRRRRA